MDLKKFLYFSGDLKMFSMIDVIYHLLMICDPERLELNENIILIPCIIVAILISYTATQNYLSAYVFSLIIIVSFLIGFCAVVVLAYLVISDKIRKLLEWNAIREIQCTFLAREMFLLFHIAYADSKDILILIIKSSFLLIITSRITVFCIVNECWIRL